MKKILLLFVSVLALLDAAVSHAATGAAFRSVGGGGGIVTEAQINLSNVTTDNADTNRHGFAGPLNGKLNSYLSGLNTMGNFDNLVRDPAAAPYAPHVTGEILVSVGGTNGYWRPIAPGTTGQVLQFGDDPGIFGVGTQDLFYGLLDPSISLILPSPAGKFLDDTGHFSSVPFADSFRVWTTESNKMSSLTMFVDNSSRQIVASGVQMISGVLDSPNGFSIGGVSVPQPLHGAVTFNASAFNVNDTVAPVAGTNPKIITVSVTGAAVGDSVAVGSPVAVLHNGDGRFTIWTACVVSANTVEVSVFLEPAGSGAYDMPSCTLGVTVFH